MSGPGDVPPYSSLLDDMELLDMEESLTWYEVVWVIFLAVIVGLVMLITWPFRKLLSIGQKLIKKSD